MDALHELADGWMSCVELALKASVPAFELVLRAWNPGDRAVPHIPHVDRERGLSMTSSSHASDVRVLEVREQGREVGVARALDLFLQLFKGLDDSSAG